MKLALACLLFASPAAAQDLVANIYTAPAPDSAYPQDAAPGGFVEVGGVLYFAAAGNGFGRELYRVPTPGALPELVVDLEPGSGSSSPEDLIALSSGGFVFTATTPATGREWYVSDGTAAGTVALPEMVPGSFDGSIAHATLVGSEVWFFATDVSTPTRALWKTDGTAAGTVKLEDLDAPGGLPQPGENVCEFGGTVYFTTQNVGGSGGYWKLMATDGTPGAATQVIEVLDSTFYGVRELTAAANGLVFAASANGVGREPWVSDGTALGTWPVELEPGTSGSSPLELTALGGRVYFTAVDPIEGREVFRSDGTSAGTELVTTADPVTDPFGASDIAGLTGALGRLFFSVDTPAFGRELWSTDGTPFTESLWADFEPGPGDGNPEDVTALGGAILCRATSGGLGAEPHASDGTPAGTLRLADLNPGGDDSDPGPFTVFGARAYFGADDGLIGDELYATDLTPAGTQLVAELAPVPFDGSSFPRGLFSMGSWLAFNADPAPDSSYQPWRTDGSAANTSQVATLDPSTNDLLPLAAFRGRVWFGVPQFGSQPRLWTSDGTAAGTAPFPVELTGASWATVWRDHLLFEAISFSQGSGLWSTDGTAAGTTKLSDVDLPSFNGYASANGFLFFRGYESATGNELWRTDGTAAGTQPAADIRPGPAWSLEGFAFEVAALGDHVYFAADEGSGERHLWRSDGTAAGTELFAVTNPAGTSIPTELEVVGDRLFFLGWTGATRHLFSTDGTTVTQLTFDPAILHQNDSYVFGSDELAFVMYSEPFGTEHLLATDGTLAGTETIATYTGASTQSWHFRGAWQPTSGEHALFFAHDDVHEQEVWVTDGTAAGTGRLTDLELSPYGPWADAGVVRMGDDLFLSGFAKVTGQELYVLPISAFGGWVAEPFGVGCAGSSGLPPSIDASGAAKVGGLLTVAVADAAPTSAIAWYFDLAHGHSTVGGCDVYLANPTLLLTTATDAFGAASLPLAIPNDPVLAGLEVWIQAAVADPGGALAGGGALTSALEVIVGP